MAARRRKAAGSAAGSKSTASKPSSRKRKREDEEPEDDEQEEQEEQDDEGDDDEVDEVVSGKTVSGLAQSNFQLPAEGDWVLRIKNFEMVRPDPENDRPGGARIYFEVLEGPIDEPEGGFSDHSEFFATKWYKSKEMDKKAKDRVRIGKEQLSRLVVKCLGELDPEEMLTWSEYLRDCKGTELIATAQKNKEGYVNIKNYQQLSE